MSEANDGDKDREGGGVPPTPIPLRSSSFGRQGLRRTSGVGQPAWRERKKECSDQ